MFSGKLLRSIAKPTRYTGGELNAAAPKAEAAASMLLVFPDLYEIGMSSLGLKIVYHLTNDHPDLWCDLAFSPWPDAEAVMRREGIPLYGLASKLAAREFDVIGFSLAYELCYTNVLNALDLAGLRVLSAERDERDPVVIAGGNCAANPAPMADFVDAFYIGEAEAGIVPVMESVANHKGAGRASVLRALADLPGVYVPSVHDADPGFTVARQYVRDLDAAPYPARQIMSLQEVEHDRVGLEIMRGCPHGCRFCQATVCCRPVRLRRVETVLGLAEEAVRETGCDEISLVSLSSTDHPQIEEIARGIMDRFAQRRVALSLPSIRANVRWVRLAAEIQKVRKTGLTLAPEAGTQRLRDVMGKNLSDDEIYEGAEEAFAQGWDRLKLYFMVGLPDEAEEDVRAIGSMASRILQIGRAGGHNPNLNISVATFVPKPGTVWERMGQDARDAIAEKHRILLDSLRARAVHLSWHDPRSSQLEAALAVGDRSVGQAIRASWERGARFDTWDEHLVHDRWREAFASVGLTLEQYANRGSMPEEDLPWSFVRLLPGEGVEVGGAAVRPARAYAKPAHRLIPGAGLAHLLTFAKGPEVRWISHLDLAKAFDRAARRAGLPVAHSHGFNPRPKIVFDGALPVGVTSECERVHIVLGDPVPSPDVVRVLSDELPAGIRIVDAVDITGRHGSPFPAHDSRTYLYRLRLSGSDGASAVSQAIGTILAKSEIVVERTKGDRTAQVDVRPGMQSLAVDAENGTEAALRAVLLIGVPNAPKVGEVADLLAAELPSLVDWTAHRIR
jgi:radical SAM family uncharacterized protein/radical SAM-linked protein